jgi:S-adenosyl methyltransferase
MVSYQALHRDIVQRTNLSQYGRPGTPYADARKGSSMTDDQSWIPAGVDTRRANTARVYDYWLGGSHNFLADQDLGRAIAAVEPNVRSIARANREFLGRGVRLVSELGIRQFLDIGSGIPTQGNVHEIAQQVSPDSRVVYADIDPVAIAHSKAILARNENAEIIDADVRDPEKILNHAVTRRLIDFDQPVGLVLGAVLPFLSDTEDPWQKVATLRDALAPGSYLVLCHATNEGRPEVAQAAEKVYNRSVAAQLRFRSRAEILRMFDGFELVEPGLVYMPQWRPDPPRDAPLEPRDRWALAGLGSISRSSASPLAPGRL